MRLHVARAQIEALRPNRFRSGDLQKPPALCRLSIKSTASPSRPVLPPKPSLAVIQRSASCDEGSPSCPAITRSEELASGVATGGAGRFTFFGVYLCALCPPCYHASPIRAGELTAALAGGPMIQGWASANSTLDSARDPHFLIALSAIRNHRNPHKTKDRDVF